MTLNRLLTYIHTHIQNDLEQVINFWKTYKFSKSSWKLKKNQNGGVHTVILQSNYHSRLYCDSHHINYLSLNGEHTFARLPVQLGQSGRCSDSGLTGLMIPLLVTYIVSKTHKGTHKFKKWMLFCWRLRQNLSYSLIDSRNLILHCLMHIFVPTY